jgi:hypothetical protein
MVRVAVEICEIGNGWIVDTGGEDDLYFENKDAAIKYAQEKLEELMNK